MSRGLATSTSITKGGLFDGLVKAKPTIQELARFRAAEAANCQITAAEDTRGGGMITLSFRGLTDPNGRDTKRLQRYWDRFLLHVGDHVITPDSQTLIDDALEDTFTSVSREVKVSTAKRRLSEVLAACPMARKQRPKWPDFKLLNAQPMKLKRKSH